MMISMLEYFGLLAEKVTRGYLPSKFLLFGLVGASGLVAHLALLRGLLAAGIGFTTAQSLVAPTAMVLTYLLNNNWIYRGHRLVGWAALHGLMSFRAVCGLGAVFNVLVSSEVYAITQMWFVAGITGAAVGAMFNYVLTSMFTWGRLRGEAF